MFRSHRLLEEKRRTAARLTSKETVCVSGFFVVVCFSVSSHRLQLAESVCGLRERQSSSIYIKVLLERKDVGKKKNQHANNKFSQNQYGCKC